jgi:hypothetical protein
LLFQYEEVARRRGRRREILEESLVETNPEGETHDVGLPFGVQGDRHRDGVANNPVRLGLSGQQQRREKRGRCDSRGSHDHYSFPPRSLASSS